LRVSGAEIPKFKMRIIEELKQYSLWEWCKFLFIIIGIVALGLWAVSQYISFRYNAYLLSAPCDVCRELNPQVEECFWVKSENNFSITKDTLLSNYSLEDLG
jgi:hypothetical protein